MPNQNPIQVVDTGMYPMFIIPSEHSGKNLFITTETSLIDGAGWKLDLIHTISLAGDPLDFNPTPDINKLDLRKKCSDLNSCRLALVSIPSRLRDGGGPIAPEVLYKLRFHADDELIDEFSFNSKNNPVTLYTKVTLKLQA